LREDREDRSPSITLHEFADIVTRFGPLHAIGSDKKTKLFQKIEQVMECEYFHGNLDRDQAQELLNDCPVGSYILRLSSEPSSPFAITWKKHKVGHSLVSYDSTTGIYSVNSTKNVSFVSGSSVVDIINSNKKKLELKEGILCKNKTWKYFFASSQEAGI